jgi:hypothetical protein
MKKIIIIAVILFFSSLFMAGTARAEIKISADFENDPLFDVKDAYPGYSKTKEVEVSNVGTDAQDLYLNIDNVTDHDFADQIKFYLKDKSSGKYLIGGSGDRFTLKDINNAGNVFVERLEPGESDRYEMKLKMNEDAGNEFQDKKTKFDIAFGFTGESISPSTPLPLRPGTVAGGTVEGAETGAGPGSQVAAAESQNSSNFSDNLPWWLWIVILLIIAGMFRLGRKLYGKKASGLSAD